MAETTNWKKQKQKANKKQNLQKPAQNKKQSKVVQLSVDGMYHGIDLLLSLVKIRYVYTDF